MDELYARTGVFLREVEPLFTTEKAVSFDPVQMLVLQRLVREGVLSASVSVRKEDFFAAVIFLDYVSEVILARTTLLEDVHVIVEELERMHEMLDPDLELLIRYTGLFIVRDLKGERYFKGATRKQIARRHDQSNQSIDWAGAGQAPADIFHAAAGKLVSDLVRHPAARALLKSFVGRNDLRAVVTLDGLLSVVPPEARPAEVDAALAAGDTAGAAVGLLVGLVTSGADWSLRAHVDQIRARLGAGGPSP